MKWRRRIFGAACTLSLMLFVATIAFAIRAEFALDKFDFIIAHRHFDVGSFKRHFYCEFYEETRDERFHAAWWLDAPIPAVDHFWEVRVARNFDNSMLIGIPHWLILLLSAPLPAWWLWSTRLRRRRIAKG